jgi:general stress protein 26
MDLAKLFEEPGIGVMATANRQGQVNSAVYARPHVIDATTLVWGMTDRRTFANISENPRAAFLFKQSGPGFQGVRLGLELLRTEEQGEMLTRIQRNTDEIVGPGAGSAVTHAVWFRVVETRPLI